MVKVKLTKIKIRACNGFKTATLGKSVNFSIMLLVGKTRIRAIIIPNKPEVSPTINVSALKTLAISFLAQVILKYQFPSFFLKRNIVIIPIIMDDTTKAIDEKAIKTIVIASIILPDKAEKVADKSL